MAGRYPPSPFLTFLDLPLSWRSLFSLAVNSVVRDTHTFEGYFPRTKIYLFLYFFFFAILQSSYLTVYKADSSLAWENTQHLARPVLVSLRIDVWGTCAEIPNRFWLAVGGKLALTNQQHYVTRHQYGISVLISQASFRGKPVVASRNVSCFLVLTKIQDGHFSVCSSCVRFRERWLQDFLVVVLCNPALLSKAIVLEFRC